MSLTVEELEIPAVRRLVPRKFGDHRGFFAETWNRRRFADAGIDLDFVQDNHSYSAAKGTLRGLHYQSPPNAQDKLVRVLRGSILDVAVDIRRGSPSYGRHVKAVISAAAYDQILVPKGFAHGFVTLEPDTEVAYKATGFYAPECDHGIAWDDPDLGIDWGVGPGEVELSDKDRRQPTFRDFESPFTLGRDC